jgi:hypothetical protein
MQYRIVSHKEWQDTEDEINTLLKEGWVLHGDLKVTDTAHIQALIQYGDYEGSNDVNVYLQNQDDIEMAIRSAGDAIGDAVETLAKAVGYAASGTTAEPPKPSPAIKPAKAKRKPSKK